MTMGSSRSRPYPGLEHFTRGDESYFFGRDEDRVVVAANLSTAPLTVLYGPSGVGKSSLLEAGVLPRLQASPDIAGVSFRRWQLEDFPAALKLSVIEEVQNRSGAKLDGGGLPLDELLLQASRAAGGTIAVILDQFEEYLRSPDRRATDFDIELARAVNRRDVPARFLISLREEALSLLDRFSERIPNLLGNCIRLRHLDATSARLAIEKPLARYSEEFPESAATIEDGLVEQILREVQADPESTRASSAAASLAPSDTGDFIDTPVLQLVLTAIWDREVSLESRVLRLRTLGDLGGAQQIADRYLTDVLDGFDAEQRRICNAIFDRVVTPSGFKIAAHENDLRKWISGAQLDAVLNTLAARRILRPIQSPMRYGSGMQYEIYHDVLARPIMKWRTSYEAACQTEAVALEAAAQRRRADAQEALSARLKRLTVLAHSRELAAASMVNLESDPERSVWLALLAAAPGFGEDGRLEREAQEALERALEASRVRQTFAGHRGPVTDLAYEPGRKRLASAGQDGIVHLWDIAGGEPLLTLAGHTAAVNGVVFLDESRLATASADRTAKIWNTASGEVLATLLGHTDRISDVDASRDGRFLITGGWDRVGRLWDTATGQELAQLGGHETRLLSVALGASGRMAATGCLDGTLKLWSVPDGAELAAILTGTGTCQAIAFSEDETSIAAAGENGEVEIWGVESRELAASIPTNSTIYAIAYPGGGRRLLTAHADGAAYVLDLGRRRPIVTLSGHTKAVTAVVSSPDGGFAATASDDGTVRIWNTMVAHEDVIFEVAFSPAGGVLATAGADGTAIIWDVESETPRLVVRHGHAINSVAFSPDGRSLAWAGDDGSTILLNAKGEPRHRVLSGHTEAVHDCVFNPAGELLATASRDGTVIVWDVSNGLDIRKLQHRNWVWQAAFSPDGRQLAAAAEDPRVLIWDVASGELARTLEGPGDAVLTLAFHPDGKLLATAGRDPAVRIWDVETGALVRVLSGHSNGVSRVIFDATGARLISASFDRTARIWDPRTGEEQLTLTLSSGLNSIDLSPDGRLLAAASDDPVLRLYSLDAGDLVRLAWRRLTRALTAEECRRHLRTSRVPPFRVGDEAGLAEVLRYRAPLGSDEEASWIENAVR